MFCGLEFYVTYYEHGQTTTLNGDSPSRDNFELLTFIFDLYKEVRIGENVLCATILSGNIHLIKFNIVVA